MSWNKVVHNNFRHNFLCCLLRFDTTVSLKKFKSKLLIFLFKNNWPVREINAKHKRNKTQHTTMWKGIFCVAFCLRTLWNDVVCKAVVTWRLRGGCGGPPSTSWRCGGGCLLSVIAAAAPHSHWPVAKSAVDVVGEMEAGRAVLRNPLMIDALPKKGGHKKTQLSDV